MATRALAPVARRRVKMTCPGKKDPGFERDCRQVFRSQDAEAIWHKLSILVRSSAPDHEAGYDQLTQDLFLELLTTDRITLYFEREYSEAAIRGSDIDSSPVNEPNPKDEEPQTNRDKGLVQLSHEPARPRFHPNHLVD